MPDLPGRKLVQEALAHAVFSWGLFVLALRWWVVIVRDSPPAVESLERGPVRVVVAPRPTNSITISNPS